MDQQKRLFVALGLSFLLTMVYLNFFAPKPVSTPEAPSAPVEKPGTTPTDPEPSRPTPMGPAAGQPQDLGRTAPSGAIAVRTIDRVRGGVRYGFSNAGGGLARAELQGPKMREQGNVSLVEGYRRLLGRTIPEPPQIDMASPVAGSPLSLAVSIEGAKPLPADLVYRIADESQDNRLVFEGEVAGWRARKVFELQQDGFGFRYSVELTNTGDSPVTGELAVHYGRAVDPTKEEPPNFFGGVGNESRSTCTVGEDVHRLLPKDDPNPEFQGPVHFFGVDQQYFLGALFPLDGARQGRCVLTASPTGRSVMAAFPLTLAPGQTWVQKFGVYIGPKDVEVLATAGASIAAPKQGAAFEPGLERTVDFGIWAFICKILLVVMKSCYAVFHNWGVAIILLTVGVKVSLLPLTHKQMVAAEQMKKLQPKMEELKKKFGDDRERLSLETMKLYQEAKVNPLGGCLPLLLQMPIWFALFTTLRNSYELYREPFISPIWMDLTYKDPTYLLPLGLGITMILTQKLQPQVMDPVQARIFTYVMPVFFTLIMLNYPSGLSLYIFTNNLLSILQQYGLRKYLEKKGVVAPRTETIRPSSPVARTSEKTR